MMVGMRGGDVGYSLCRYLSPGGWVRANDGNVSKGFLLYQRAGKINW